MREQPYGSLEDKCPSRRGGMCKGLEVEPYRPDGGRQEGRSDREEAGQLGTRAGRAWQGFTSGDMRKCRRCLTGGCAVT